MQLACSQLAPTWDAKVTQRLLHEGKNGSPRLNKTCRDIANHFIAESRITMFCSNGFMFQQMTSSTAVSACASARLSSTKGMAYSPGDTETPVRPNYRGC